MRAPRHEAGFLNRLFRARKRLAERALQGDVSRLRQHVGVLAGPGQIGVRLLDQRRCGRNAKRPRSSDDRSTSDKSVDIAQALQGIGVLVDRPFSCRGYLHWRTNSVEPTSAASSGVAEASANASTMGAHFGMRCSFAAMTKRVRSRKRGCGQMRCVVKIRTLQRCRRARRVRTGKSAQIAECDQQGSSWRGEPILRHPVNSQGSCCNGREWHAH
jgi:hypothetical protein